MSTATHGYSNIHAQGKPYYNTVHRIGSGKTAQNVLNKVLSELTAVPQAIVSVTTRDKAKELIIEITGHGAKIGDVCRIYSGVAIHIEYDIVEIIDVDKFVVQNVAGVIPVAADTAKVLFYVSPKGDSEGNVNFSPGPTQFVQNGAPVQVTEDSVTPANNKSLPVKSTFRRNGAEQAITEDTAAPANNRPLPAGLYIVKDGVIHPVTKDTGTPSNTLAIPVEIVQASGSPITFTAGDINIQLSHLGANFDSTRIGDGTNLLLVNADGSINVNDAAVLAKLTSLDGKDFSTATKQDLAKTVLDNILTAIGVTNAKDFSTAAKQDLAKTVLDNILTAIGVTNGKDFSTSAKQDLAKAVLDVIQTNTLNTSSKLPATLGQKAMAASLAVTLASDQSSVPITVETLNQQSLTAGALNADLIPSTDVSKYAYLSLQVTGTWVGALTLQGSNDNVTWTAVNLQALSSGSSGVTNSISANSFAVAPIFFKYLRVRMTAYTSGAANGAAFFSVTGPDSLGADTVLQAGAWTVTTTASAVAGTVSSAQVSVGTTAVRATVAGTAPNAARKLLLIKPSKNNTGAIYIGPSTVTAANGMEILGPDRVEFDFDAGDYYLISDTVGQTVEILEKI